MKVTVAAVTLAFAWAAPTDAQQAWTGTLSDSMCGSSHQAAHGGKTDRQCLFECINNLAKYVLVDKSGQVIPIFNQDVAGFPLYAGRPVHITGELRDHAILVSRIEAIAAHLHLGHVMTNWRDTPRNTGLLFAAMADATVAAEHAKLAQSAGTDLDAVRLHTGHVLNALDPTIQPKGAGSGYGVKKAASGALQHIGFAVQAEGATDNIRTYATRVTASLANVTGWTDQAISVAQEIRTAASGDAVASLVARLIALTTNITDGTDANGDGQIGSQGGEGGLRQAQAQMELLMQGEGLQNASR